VNVLKFFTSMADVKIAIDQYEVANKLKFVAQTATKNFGGDGMQFILNCCYHSMRESIMAFNSNRIVGLLSWFTKYARQC